MGVGVILMLIASSSKEEPPTSTPAQKTNAVLLCNIVKKRTQWMGFNNPLSDAGLKEQEGERG